MYHIHNKKPSISQEENISMFKSKIMYQSVLVCQIKQKPQCRNTSVPRPQVSPFICFIYREDKEIILNCTFLIAYLELPKL